MSECSRFRQLVEYRDYDYRTDPHSPLRVQKEREERLRSEAHHVAWQEDELAAMVESDSDAQLRKSQLLAVIRSGEHESAEQEDDDYDNLMGIVLDAARKRGYPLDELRNSPIVRRYVRRLLDDAIPPTPGRY